MLTIVNGNEGANSALCRNGALIAQKKGPLYQVPIFSLVQLPEEYGVHKEFGGAEPV